MKKFTIGLLVISLILMSASVTADCYYSEFGSNMKIVYVDNLATDPWRIWDATLTRTDCQKWDAQWARREDGKSSTENFFNVRISQDRSDVHLAVKGCGYTAEYTGSVVSGTHTCGGGGGTFDLYMNQ